ncbi:DNA polymerase III subunit gamma/tau [Hylemonella gracilis]|uniref:DNA polymerase III subunit gamma/tau n=1 Tax=Hylemonella gracilis ATCC 19624 TaxID=887062 RepID=F3KRP3_9BURK|nr:DNA polymerase III subunit gamma/tau [Hylemonella gracilis]EGI77560.1 DNA polymerase III subunits gamma and tau [Hylemonella gracilis ATCC 19624]
MSYLVLARKYRPRSFSEMVGQEHVVQALANALTQQRLHHAYLFTGTRGVGKTTVSRVLAKSLNCIGPDGQGGITAQPCGTCPACLDIDAGRFVDYTELDAASNRGVDEVQALLEQAVYKPVQGRFKVFMIDEVHMLTNTAFNAMLKTLEEPPEYLKFVLATTDPQKVPVTVLSRCLQFNLRPMAPETVLEHLTRVLAAENVAAETGALRLLARAARGSMRDALSLTDQAIAFGGGRLEEAAVRQMLGSADRGHVLRLIDALARGDGLTVVETSEALRLHGLSAPATLEEMSAVLQRMAVHQATGGARPADAADLADPDAAEIARLAAVLPPDETQLLYSICLHGRAELGLAPDEYAGLTMVLLRLLAFKPGASVGAHPGSSASASQEKKTLASAEAEAESQPRVPVAALPASAAGSAPAPRPSPMPAPYSPAPQVVTRMTVPQAVAPTRPLVPEATSASSASASSAVTPSSAVHAAVASPATASAPAGSSAMTAPRPGQRLPVVDAVRPAPPQPSRPMPAAPQPPAEPVPLPVRTAPEARLDAPMPGATGTPLVPTEEGDFWHGLVRQLIAAEAVTALVRELALQSQLVARDTSGNSQHWLLRVERESLNSGSSRERLQAALQAAGHAVTLTVEIGRVSDSPAKRNAAAAAERQQAAEQLVHENPFVQAMMRDFGAKIVPGSIKAVDA